MVQATSLVGQRFGKLIVISFSHYHETRKCTVWNCLCDCGNSKKIARGELISKTAISCGCYRREYPRKIKHGLTNHPLYQVWADMKFRCNNPNASNYSDYGARGISVCEKWNSDFQSFYNWSIQNGYKKGLELDRYPNNDGNYEPTNCRWATRIGNANNTRRTVFAEVNGVRKTASEWAAITGINRKCIYHRIKIGLTGELAVFGEKRLPK